MLAEVLAQLFVPICREKKYISALNSVMLYEDRARLYRNLLKFGIYRPIEGYIILFNLIIYTGSF